jgi:predicted dehydrogenase
MIYLCYDYFLHMNKHLNPVQSRRSFLKNSAKACVILGFPTIIPASAMGRNGTVAPSARLTLGHIGCGKMGGLLRGSFAGMPDVQVVACSDVESQRLVEYQAFYSKALGDRVGGSAAKGVETYNDYHDLLARPDIDGVIISTPDHWHANMTIDACRMGKDVYCEKPLTHTVAQAYRVADAVKQYGRVLQTGSMQRSSSEFRFAAEMVRNGRIGKVHTINCAVGGAPHFFYDLVGQKQTTFDWDRWVGPSQYQPYNYSIAPPDPEKGNWPNWREYADFGGGGQCDWGAHMYDIAQWGLGRDGETPVEVLPAGSSPLAENRLTYLYADGVKMTRGDITQFPGRNGGLEFIGEEGAIYVNRGQLETSPASLKNTATLGTEERVYNSTNHHRDFINCMKTREQPICNEDVGASTAVICNLGNIADRIGQSFKWNYSTGLTDNEEANRYLNPPARANYAL